MSEILVEQEAEKTAHQLIRHDYVICVICSTSFSIMIMSAAATVNFMTQKMIVEFEEGKEPGTVMKDVLKACKKVEPDCEIAL